HAVRHVREEALPRLLSVVPDVDPGLDLVRDAHRGRVGDRALELVGIDGLAATTASVQFCERRRTRQAARVRRQEAALARAHSRLLGGTRLPTLRAVGGTRAPA